jgi:hypothetical protein
MSKNKPRNDLKTPGTEAPKASRLADYFWANLIFFGFLLVLAFVVRKSAEAPGDDAAVKIVLDETFRFMLLLFGGGFLLVTLFDAAYEFFASQAEEAGAENPPK